MPSQLVKILLAHKATFPLKLAGQADRAAFLSIFTILHWIWVDGLIYWLERRSFTTATGQLLEPS